jgi:LmbE family N-acetylglucosaminyl deacetylase
MRPATRYFHRQKREIFVDLLTEGFLPHNVKKAYIWGSEKADVWVDITETIDMKIDALRKHASQMGDWDPAEEMRNWGSETGKEHGMAYAESFKVMNLGD